MKDGFVKPALTFICAGSKANQNAKCKLSNVVCPMSYGWMSDAFALDVGHWTPVGAGKKAVIRFCNKLSLTQKVTKIFLAKIKLFI